MEALDPDEVEALYKVGIKTSLDVLSLSSRDLARKLGVPDAQSITDRVAALLTPASQTILTEEMNIPERVCTGDVSLDASLGGGFMTGAVWEIVGESSSGKTQLAMQMLLMSMILPSSGKLARSACYISTRHTLPTERLTEMLSTHPLLSGAGDIATALNLIAYNHLSDVGELVNLLSIALPRLASERTANHAPLKLVVIDSLAPLLAFKSRRTFALLRARTQRINEIGGLLRNLARTFNLAVIVINEVHAVFSRDTTVAGPAPLFKGQINGLALESQAEWFARTPHELTDVCDERQEAQLGARWAYQIQARIMLSKTTRTVLSTDVATSKKTGSLIHPSSPSFPPVSPDLRLAKRNLTVLFSAYGARTSIDFVVMSQGIVTLAQSLVTYRNPKYVAESDSAAPAMASGEKTLDIALEMSSFPKQPFMSEPTSNHGSLDIAKDNVDWAFYYPHEFAQDEDASLLWDTDME